MRIDSSSDTWLDIEKWTTDQLIEMREQNDNDLNKNDTAKLRGRIEFAKDLLALTEKPAPEPEVRDHHYVD